MKLEGLRELLELKTARENIAQAMAGTRRFQKERCSGGVAARWAKMRGLSPADGGRGCQVDKGFGNGLGGFINNSFQTGFDFLQSVAITSRNCVG